MDFILTSHNTLAIVDHCETYSKQPPPSLFMPALSHPDLDIQATPPLLFLLLPLFRPPFPLTTVSAYDLPGGQSHSPQTVHRALICNAASVCVAAVKPSHCAAACWTRPGRPHSRIKDTFPPGNCGRAQRLWSHSLLHARGDL